MPFAATHILIAIILIELFREYFIKDNNTFPRYYIFIAAIGAILPDLDLGIYYVLYFFGFSLEQIHRTFLHSIFIPLILLLIGILILYFNIKSSEVGKHHMKTSTIFFILAFGSALHLVLDATLAGTIILFYPFSQNAVGLNLINIFPEGLKNLILPTLDAILLIFWISWMQFKLKITDYF